MFAKFIAQIISMHVSEIITLYNTVLFVTHISIKEEKTNKQTKNTVNIGHLNQK